MGRASFPFQRAASTRKVSGEYSSPQRGRRRREHPPLSQGACSVAISWSRRKKTRNTPTGFDAPSPRDSSTRTSFRLLNVLPEERVVIGASTTRRFGSRHDPQAARAALEESRGEVERLVSRYSVVILVASGGKGTGAGTVFPLAEMVRQQRKLIIPIFVRPSFEHHEVEKQRYDHALQITDQFDAAKIRLVEILNERGYVQTDPQPQAVVWERMNRPIARGCAACSTCCPTCRRSIHPTCPRCSPARAGCAWALPRSILILAREPSDAQIDAAARACWDGFVLRLPWAGRDLADLHPGRLVEPRRCPNQEPARDGSPSPETPPAPLQSALRAGLPDPEAVGRQRHLRGIHRPQRIAGARLDASRHERSVFASQASVHASPMPSPGPDRSVEPSISVLAPVALASPRENASPATGRGFPTLWEFAVALNRQDAAALAMARDGADSDMSFEGVEVKKLLNQRLVSNHFSLPLCRLARAAAHGARRGRRDSEPRGQKPARCDSDAPPRSCRDERDSVEHVRP